MKLFHKKLNFCLISLPLIIFSTFYTAGQTTRLIVIDPLAKDEIGNITSTYPGQKVITLPDEGNPLKFIANVLKDSLYDEIHLYLLTKPGSLIFDEINIIPENIQDYSGDFGEWKNITKSGSKIIIHSESLTSVQGGLFLAGKITDFTGKAVIIRK